VVIEPASLRVRLEAIMREAVKRYRAEPTQGRKKARRVVKSQEE